MTHSAESVALTEAWTRLVEDESGRPWREASSGIVTHAMLRCLRPDDLVRQAVRYALNAWLHRCENYHRSYLMPNDEAAVAEDVVRYLAARIDGRGDVESQ